MRTAILLSLAFALAAVPVASADYYDEQCTAVTEEFGYGCDVDCSAVVPQLHCADPCLYTLEQLTGRCTPPVVDPDL